MNRRTFIFTEEQLNKILGENFSAYLDKSDNGCAFNDDSIESVYGEIKTGEKGNNNPVTTDKVAGEKVPEHPWLRRSYNTLYEHKKKTTNINERNQYLDGQTFRLGANTNKMVDNLAAKNSNDKMLNNMSNDKDTCLATHYTRLNRLKKMKTEDPIRYNRINGKELEKTISTTIEKAKVIGNSLQKNKTNVFHFDTSSKINNKKGHHKDCSATPYCETR